MNKFAKGSLAAGAGLVLLLGGAGTLAYWNDTAGVTGGTIEAGTLDLKVKEHEAGKAGTWYHQGDVIDDASTWAIVPGDELTYEVDLSLIAVGNNMAGEIALNQDFVISEAAGQQITVDLEVADGEALPNGVKLSTTAEDTLEFTGQIGAETAPATLPVQVTVSFPFDEAEDQNSSKGAVVNLEKVNFTATQTPAGTAVYTTDDV
jgi:alternate signal-mediated exported protein